MASYFLLYSAHRFTYLNNSVTGSELGIRSLIIVHIKTNLLHTYHCDIE